MALSVTVGSKPLDLATVVDAVTGYDDALDDHLIVRDLRVPRTVLTLVVGIAIGLSGAIMQGRHPEPARRPGLLGVNAGASLVVVIGIDAFDLTSVLGHVAGSHLCDSRHAPPMLPAG